MKKILLSLCAVAAITAPIATVVACGKDDAKTITTNPTKGTKDKGDATTPKTKNTEDKGDTTTPKTTNTEDKGDTTTPKTTNTKDKGDATTTHEKDAKKIKWDYANWKVDWNMYPNIKTFLGKLKPEELIKTKSREGDEDVSFQFYLTNLKDGESLGDAISFDEERIEEIKNEYAATNKWLKSENVGKVIVAYGYSDNDWDLDFYKVFKDQKGVYAKSF